MPSDDLTALTVSVAELKIEVAALTDADRRMRENVKGIYGKIDRLTYTVIALLAGIIGDIISHNLN